MILPQDVIELGNQILTDFWAQDAFATMEISATRPILSKYVVTLHCYFFVFLFYFYDLQNKTNRRFLKQPVSTK